MSTMKKHITTVMYHYVRDMHLSDYPGIKGVRVQAFKEQLDYFKRFYEFVSVRDCIRFLDGEENALPENPILLTFDDGFIDHYENVHPVLSSMGITGAFYPPVMSVRDAKMLPVHKIHFILAGTDIDTIISEIRVLLNEMRKERAGIPLFEELYAKLAVPNHLDPGEVIFVKRLLQLELDEDARGEITDALFEKFTGESESEFAKRLYLNEFMIKEMSDAGMEFGGHGYSHQWLNSLDVREQTAEARESFEYLQKLGVIEKEWSFCYPYGGYDDSLLDVLKGFDTRVGFTTKVDFSVLSTENALTLERFDTIHFPFEKDAAPNELTLKSLELNNV